VRPIESPAPAGPFGTVVPACMHDRVSSPNREETPTEGSLDPGLNTHQPHLPGRDWGGHTGVAPRPCPKGKLWSDASRRQRRGDRCARVQLQADKRDGSVREEGNTVGRRTAGSKAEQEGRNEAVHSREGEGSGRNPS